MKQLINALIIVFSVILIIAEIATIILCWVIVPKLVSDSNVAMLLNSVAHPVTDILEGENAIVIDEFDPSTIKGDVAEIMGHNVQISGNTISKFTDITSYETTLYYNVEGEDFDNVLTASLDQTHDIPNLVYPYLQGKDSETDVNLVNAIASITGEYLDPGVVEKYFYYFKNQPVPLMRNPETDRWYSVVPQDVGTIVMMAPDPMCLTDQWTTIHYRKLEDVDTSDTRAYSLYELEAIYNKQREIAEDADGAVSVNMAGLSHDNTIPLNEETGTEFNDEKHKTARKKVLDTLKNNKPTEDGHVGDIDFKIKEDEGKRNMFTIKSGETAEDGNILVSPDSLTVSAIKFSNVRFGTVTDGEDNLTGFSLNNMDLENLSAATRPYVLIVNLISENDTLLAEQYVDGTEKGLSPGEKKSITFQISDIKYKGKLKGIQIIVV